MRAPQASPVRGGVNPRLFPVGLGARGVSARPLFSSYPSAGRVAVIARHLSRRPTTRSLLNCLRLPAGSGYRHPAGLLLGVPQC